MIAETHVETFCNYLEISIQNSFSFPSRNTVCRNLLLMFVFEIFNFVITDSFAGYRIDKHTCVLYFPHQLHINYTEVWETSVSWHRPLGNFLSTFFSLLSKVKVFNSFVLSILDKTIVTKSEYSKNKYEWKKLCMTFSVLITFRI